MVTDEQRAILGDQVQKVRDARHALAEAEALLRNMLVLAEPRFSDPASGLKFDVDALAFQSQTNATDAESVTPRDS